MNRPANRYRAEHRAVEAAANELSGLGRHGLANHLWSAAGTLKALGKPENQCDGACGCPCHGEVARA